MFLSVGTHHEACLEVRGRCSGISSPVTSVVLLLNWAILSLPATPPWECWSTDIERCIQLTQRGLLPCLSSPTLPSSCLLCRISLCSPRLALNSRSLALQVYTTCLPLTAQFLVCELLNLKCLVGRTYLDLRTCFPESICP